MRALPIRWRLTVWYGAVLAAILALVSLAAYDRYRSAARRAFDEDILVELDGIQGALQEEMREAAGDEAQTVAPMERLRRAAKATVDEFRLSEIAAEIRGGPDAEIALAHTARLGAPDASLFDFASWRRLSRAPAASLLPCEVERRCAVRRLPPVADLPVATLAIARPTAGVLATLASIRRSLFEVGMAGLALALLGGYWLATRALRPIDLLTTQAGRLAQLPEPTAATRLEIPNPDDELGRLATTLNRLLVRIEAAVTQRKSFIADAAHELKTPVAIVRAEAELALSTPRSAEAYRESLIAIAGETERLSRLVADLTLLAEGQALAQPLERRLVDLTELLQDVRRSLRPVAASRDVRIEIDSRGCAEYRGDERLLRQTFTNLVENAAKFSPHGGFVRVGVNGGPGLHEIRVEDAAPTLSAEEREHVFERFYRTDSARDGDSTGNGLGLAIVQWAVRLHGGRVHVEPRKPRGNAFVVELPVPEPAPAP